MVKRKLGEEKGSVMVMVVIGLLVIMGFTGLVIDGGSAYLTKSRLQNAADAGALAGITVSSANSETEARKFTKLNAVEHGADETTVIAQYIAAGGTPTTVNAYTEAELTEMKDDLVDDLEDMTDLDIINTADEYSVDISGYTNGSGDNRTFKTTSKTLEEITEEVKNELMEWSGAELMNEATALGLNQSGWTTGNGKWQESKRNLCITTILATTKWHNEISKRLAAASGTNYKSLVIEMIAEAQIEDLRSEQKTTTPGNLDRLKVTCTRTVHNSFMSLFGFPNSTVSAFAVAENSGWAGDALPFINLDGYPSTEGEDLEAWNKVGPGDKERISNDDLIVSPNRIQVEYLDGITFKKGKVMSQIKNPLQNIVGVGKTVYLFSVKNTEVDNYKKKAAKELKNGDIIPLSDIVLLECIVTEEWNGTVLLPPHNVRR